jgi:hypothetical protein
MSRQRLLLHLVAATCLNRAATSIKALGECSLYPHFAADLPHDPFQGIVCPKAPPVFSGEIHVVQCLFNIFLHQLAGLGQLHGFELLLQVSNLLVRSLLVLLGVDGLEHRRHLFHLARRHHRLDIAVEVNHAPLPLRCHFAAG